MSMHGYKGWDEEDRRKTMDPDVILRKAGLGPGMTFVDIGCGQGYFSIPAAHIVGPRGKVYGIDVDAEALGDLRTKAAEHGLSVVTIEGEGERTIPCRKCADVVFFGICLHDFGKPKKVLDNARNMLKAGGRLANLDWNTKPTGHGPPMHIRIGEEKAKKLIEAAGFAVDSCEDVAGRYYLIVSRLMRPAK